MLNVKLIYDSGCPNTEAARRHLQHALAAAGLPDIWKEWNRTDPTCPPHARYFGSPTILVDGRDLVGETARENTGTCRIYRTSDGRTSGVPPIHLLIQALFAGGGSES
jgi:hypothetical protein